MSSQYVFKEHAGVQGAPLFVVLHGTGGDENQFFDLARQLLPTARIVAPRGDVSEGGALRYFRRTGEGVYDMDDLARRTESLADFIDGLGHDGPIIGLGYSNGANILAAMMLSRPDLFAASVLMHPLIPWSPDSVPELNGKAILVTAGRRDPICPAPTTQALIDFFAVQGADIQSFWHNGGHEIAQDELMAINAFLSRFKNP